MGAGVRIDACLVKSRRGVATSQAPAHLEREACHNRAWQHTKNQAHLAERERVLLWQERAEAKLKNCKNNFMWSLHERAKIR